MKKATTRGAAGAGSIRQRKDGTWEGRFTYKDSLGKSQRTSLYAGTQAECGRKLREATTEVDETGTYTKRQRVTLSEWSETWLAEYCAIDLKPRTVECYEAVMRERVLPALGTVQLSALSNITIQRFLNGIRGKNGQTLSPKTIKNTHGVLHSCLRQAVISGLIPANPADNIRLPKVGKSELRPLLDSDLSRFLNACEGHRYGKLFIFDAFTGLRQSEALGLQWRDIDFTGGTIHVCRQLQKERKGEGYITLTTKNGKDRYVPFPPSIGAILKEVKREQAAHQLAAGELWQNKEGYVFTNEFGQHLAHSSVQNSFRKFVRSLGLNGTRFHDLRHTAASVALESGANIKSVQEMLGHYSAAFTLDVYSDVSRRMTQDTQSRLEAAFQAAKIG